MADQAEPGPTNWTRAKDAFTLAEVLITLGIIGIVAALTMPALIANYRKNIITTRLKTTYSVLSQAYLQAIEEHGEFKTPGLNYWSEYDYARQLAFFKERIFPYLKIVENCGSGAASLDKSCAVIEAPSSLGDFTRFATKVVLANGVHLSMVQKGEYETFFFVDVNGLQKPNQAGIDRFLFTGGTNRIFAYAWTSDAVISALSGRDYYMALCEAQPIHCAALIQYDNWEIKDDYPWL